MSGPRADNAHQEMHARLLNWGKWAAEGLGDVSGQSAHALEVVDSDAQEVEAALLVMQRKRPQLYHYVRRAYLQRWGDITIAQEMRIGDTGLRAVRVRTYEWLGAYFEGAQARATLAVGKSRSTKRSRDSDARRVD